MEQTLNHFENAAFSATACDMEGTIVYQTLGNHHRLARGLSYIR